MSGDYDHRERGLRSLYRPLDLLEFDIHRMECKMGLVKNIPESYRVPYGILWSCADSRGISLGVKELGSSTPPSHPCLYLWSSIRIKGHSGGYYPPLVTSAMEELKGMKLMRFSDGP